jgi:glyoxylase-like metal-dependent hydrolase (beta-lactamase superfamily II)
VLIHEDDAKWVQRRDPSIQPWAGETHGLGGGVTLIRTGGHYAGSTVLHWRDRRALLTGDSVHVVPNRSYVAFMYSYPNMIPLAPSQVQAIAASLDPYEYDTLYGAWWDRFIPADASGVVRRSADRYVRAVADPGLPS